MENNPSFNHKLIAFVVRHRRIFQFVVVVLFLYSPIFLHLDGLPVRIFDESRMALNATEMYENGNLLVTHCKGEPEMWNTKPPFLIWVQAGFFKLIGPGELALRLPSAIAALLTGFMIVYFCTVYLESFMFGLITILVLFTSVGYVEDHAIRTGDFDAMLTMFITAYCLVAFMFSQTGNRKLIRYFFVLVTLAVLTKSIQAVIMGPAVVAFVLIAGRKHLNRPVLKEVVIGGLASVAVIMSYYLGRESVNPGYLQAVWDNELGGRYATTLEGHRHPFMYYYDSMVDHHFSTWYLLVPFGLALGLFAKDRRLRKVTVFAAILTIWYWLIISSAQTKLIWYEIPLFPWVSILAAVFLYMVFDVLRRSNFASEHLSINIIPWIFLVYIFYAPYSKTLDRVYFPKEYYWNSDTYEMLHYLKKYRENKVDMPVKTVCVPLYDVPYHFYRYLLQRQGKTIELASREDISVSDTLLVHDEGEKKWMLKHFECERRNIYGRTVEEFIILAEKDTSTIMLDSTALSSIESFPPTD